MNQSESKPQIDVYSIVTNRIIELLEAGTVPWHKPWIEAGLPQNLISKRPYRGINLLLLNSLDYKQNLFLTWKQLKTISASVKKGERGSVVIYSKTIEAKEKGTKPKYILRYYKVFNIEQCNDIPKAFIPEAEEKHNEPILECQSIISTMKEAPKIVHKKGEAFYVPSEDYINIPKITSFEKSESYYGTLFHELIHSTGHEKRLNRKEVANNTAFGSEMYSQEELVAEMGACYLNSYSGISSGEIDNNAAYIKSWLNVLKGDKSIVIKAASKAQQAVEYILNVNQSVTEEIQGIDHDGE